MCQYKYMFSSANLWADSLNQIQFKKPRRTPPVCNDVMDILLLKQPPLCLFFS
jgi:hypothetical protein